MKTPKDDTFAESLMLIGKGIVMLFCVAPFVLLSLVTHPVMLYEDLTGTGGKRRY